MAVERNSTEAAFRERYRKDSPGAAPPALRLVDWAKRHGLRLRPRAGPTHDTLIGFLVLGANDHKIFTMETNGLLWVLFTELERRFPSTDRAAVAQFKSELRKKLEGVRGGRAAPGSDQAKASWRLEQTDEAALVGVLEWVVAELRRHYDDLLDDRRKRREG